MNRDAPMQQANSGPRLDHVGIAVDNLEEAISVFETLLGVQASGVEEVPSESVRIAFFEVGDCRLELLAPIEGRGPIHDFLAAGRRGVHHVALRVERGAMQPALERLAAGGIRCVGEAPRAGSEGSSVAFVHPRDAQGVLVELVEPAPTEDPPHEP